MPLTTSGIPKEKNNDFKQKMINKIEIKLNLLISQDTRLGKQLKEYFSRYPQKSKEEVVKEAIESYLDCRLDDSIESWYAYILKNQCDDPKKAEELAYCNHRANMFVPDDSTEYDTPF